MRSSADTFAVERRRYRTFDVPYLRIGATELLARVYRPEGDSPFPVVLDVHGGVWSGGDRASGAVYCAALAERGILVVSTDHRTAPDHPYPAQVADQNYAVRWLKAKAAELGGDATHLGAIGSSSGGHTVLLNAMRPDDPRYAAHPLESDAAVDAVLSYVITFSPVVDPYARYEHARTHPTGRSSDGPGTLEARTRTYFVIEEAMREGSPQGILDREEPVHTPPLLVIHPNVDANVPRPLIERFVASYRAAGGEAEVHWFEGVGHAFVRTAGDATDRAVAIVADFASRHQ